MLSFSLRMAVFALLALALGVLAWRSGKAPEAQTFMVAEASAEPSAILFTHVPPRDTCVCQLSS